jgi:hypothetical protein
MLIGDQLQVSLLIPMKLTMVREYQGRQPVFLTKMKPGTKQSTNKVLCGGYSPEHGITFSS